jgi:outer membrane receptor protein involved in Fe transport
VDPNPNLLPEEAEDFEMGLRGKIPVLGNTLSYDVALYHTKIKNMIVTEDVGGTDAYVNAGKVLVQGVETSLSYQPHDNWRFDIAHSYADNEYLDYNTGGTDYSGNTLAYSPINHLNARVTWMPIHGLAAELEMDHISEYYTSTSNADSEGKVNRPDIFNLRVTYETGPWEIWGHVLNLTDREYAERISYSDRSRSRSFNVAPPRTFYMGVGYNW